MTTGRVAGSACSARTTASLSSGSARRRRVDAEPLADRLGDVAPVAGDHRDLRGRRRRAGGRDRRGRPARRRSPQHDHAGRRAVDGDEDLRAPPSARAARAGVDAALAQPGAALPTTTRRPADACPRSPSPGRSCDVLRQRERAGPAPRRRARAPRASDVGGDLVQRRGQPQHLVRPAGLSGDDVLDARRAERERAGLVEQHRARPRRAARSTPPPLTTTPARAARETPETNAIGAARMSGHGVATTRTASARTASPLTAHATPASEQRDGQEERGVAVGHPHERRVLGLGRFDEAHEPGVRALRGGPGRAQLERLRRVGGPAAHRCAAPRARRAAARRSARTRRRSPRRT